MSRNNDKAKSKTTFSSLMENNKIVFLFSLIVAIVCWCAVSILRTPVVEKVFTDVKVNINMDESLPQNSGLEIFGNKDFTVDVTVRGLSYVVNTSSFKNNIVVNASSSAVATAGTYDLPVSASIAGNPGDAEITNISKQSIKVDFDERITKSFGLAEEIVELEDYSLAAGCERENPRLSTEILEISGPSREMKKITSLKARVELGGELKETASIEAEIIAEGPSGVISLDNFTMDITEPVYITIPVKRIEKFDAAVSFTGMPQALRKEGIEYTVYPAQIDLSVIPESDDTLINDNNQFIIGTVDFSTLSDKVNKIRIKSDTPGLEDITFVVTIDMSSQYKRWLEVPVDTSAITLPEGVSVVTESIKSVQLIGNKTSLKNIDSSAAYAVPVLDGIELTPGTHKVPAKIMLRTITDSWVYSTYEMEISVE